MPYVWSETEVPDGVQHSGWDPYSNPPGEGVFEWIVVLSTIPAAILWFAFVQGPPETVCLCAVFPLSVYFLSSWWRRYRFTVSVHGYRLHRTWFGVTWFDRDFEPGAVLEIADDPWEPGVTGLIIYGDLLDGGIHFGRGRDADELLARIKTIAESAGIWSACFPRSDTAIKELNSTFADGLPNPRRLQKEADDNR